MKFFNFYKKIFLFVNLIFITNLSFVCYSNLSAMQNTDNRVDQDPNPLDQASKTPENICWNLISNSIKTKLQSLIDLHDKLKTKKTELENLIKNKSNIPDLNSKLEIVKKYIDRLKSFIEFEFNTGIALQIERKLNSFDANPNMSHDISHEEITRLNLYANQENPNNCLFKIMDKTKCSFAKAHLAIMLSKKDLNTETAKFNALNSNQDLFNQLDKALYNFAQAEKLFFEEFKTLNNDFKKINFIDAVINSNSWANFLKTMTIASSHIWGLNGLEKLAGRAASFKERFFYFGIPSIGIPGLFQNSLSNILQPNPLVYFPETEISLLEYALLDSATKSKFSLHFSPANLIKPSTLKDAGLFWATVAFPTLKFMPFINPTLQFLYKKYAIRRFRKIKKDILVKHIENMQKILNSLEEINNIIKSNTVFNNLSNQIESLINNYTEPEIRTAIENTRETITDKTDLAELEQKFNYLEKIFNYENENLYFISIIKNVAELDYFVSLVKFNKEQNKNISTDQRNFLIRQFLVI
ncbi:MAG: hypothetical protein WC436_01390 [Candidatus Babeliales bacterium]